MNDYPDPDARIETPFALKALVGFGLTAVALALSVPSRSSAPALVVVGTLVLMLFFRSTRAFGLGGLLFIGVAFLALLAICGNSHF